MGAPDGSCTLVARDWPILGQKDAAPPERFFPPVPTDLTTPTMTSADARGTDLPPRARLDRHLGELLGQWPPRSPLDVLAWPGRDAPGWNGGTRAGVGIASPDGTVLSLSPALGVDVEALDRERIARALHQSHAERVVPQLLGLPDRTLGRATYRWSDAPKALPEVGEWVPTTDPRIPEWLRAFRREVLVAWAKDGSYAAGVGRKLHDAFGHELAVGTEPEYRGKGLASRLVAQAARRVIADGAVPIYLHGPGNVGSARVAEAAGFPDRGWRLLELRQR